MRLITKVRDIPLLSYYSVRDQFRTVGVYKRAGAADSGAAQFDRLGPPATPGRGWTLNLTNAIQQAMDAHPTSCAGGSDRHIRRSHSAILNLGRRPVYSFYVDLDTRPPEALTCARTLPASGLFSSRRSITLQ